VKVYAELHQIDQAILKAESSEHLAQEALIRIEKLIPFSRASISLFDVDLNEATVLALKSEEGIDFQSSEIFLSETEISKDFEMLNVGKVLIF
jgi:hypothetical protein